MEKRPPKQHPFCPKYNEPSATHKQRQVNRWSPTRLHHSIHIHMYKHRATHDTIFILFILNKCFSGHCTPAGGWLSHTQTYYNFIHEFNIMLYAISIALNIFFLAGTVVDVAVPAVAKNHQFSHITSHLNFIFSHNHHHRFGFSSYPIPSCGHILYTLEHV